MAYNVAEYLTFPSRRAGAEIAWLFLIFKTFKFKKFIFQEKLQFLWQRECAAGRSESSSGADILQFYDENRPAIIEGTLRLQPCLIPFRCNQPTKFANENKSCINQAS